MVLFLVATKKHVGTRPAYTQILVSLLSCRCAQRLFAKAAHVRPGCPFIIDKNSGPSP